VRRGLAKLLEIEDAVEVVGEAQDGVEAISLLPSARPDVALVDARMPRMDGSNSSIASPRSTRMWPLSYSLPSTTTSTSSGA
jgi:DNA-binding NarL/FixJ family response regulator